jgi:hypothetical protein
MQRKDKLITSRCDYILSTDRRLFKNISLKDPTHYFSDHLMVIGVLVSRPIKENKRYLKGRRKFTIEMGKCGPLTKADALFLDLKGFVTETKQRPR